MDGHLTKHTFEPALVAAQPLGSKRRITSPKFLSLETTGKSVEDVISATDKLPAGTPVNIAWLDHSTSTERLGIARQLKRNGLSPVPIISTRRIKSKAELFAITEQLVREVAPKQFMVVGGDPKVSAGPFEASSSLLSSD